MYSENEILQFLECPAGKRGIRQLNRLVRAYVLKVPWESVYRIVKYAQTPALSQRPRWPEEFWQDAIQTGGGGTCFESNYAFFHLLKGLGYSGYLTVNDMGEQLGCHSAIIIRLEGRLLLVDVGIPLHAILPVDLNRVTRRITWLHTYTVKPTGAECFQVERSNHPQRNIYTLLNKPVGEIEYRQVVEQDYSETGLFLNRVVIVKVVDGRLWRFNSLDRPYRLEGFAANDRVEIPLDSTKLVPTLGKHFQMDEGKIETALQIAGEEAR